MVDKEFRKHEINQDLIFEKIKKNVCDQRNKEI